MRELMCLRIRKRFIETILKGQNEYKQINVKNKKRDLIINQQTQHREKHMDLKNK